MRQNVFRSAWKVAAVAMVAAGIFRGQAYAVNDVLTKWTFETSVPTTAGPHAAEVGSGSALGFHSGATAYSNPTGPGYDTTPNVSESFSSTNWLVNDYYQFQTSTTGITSNFGLSFDHVSSATGPRDFELRYSLDDSTYTPVGTYVAQVNGTPFWDSLVALEPAGIDTKVFDLTGITAINNQANVYFRLVNTTTAAASSHLIAATNTGSNRIDNFTVYQNFNATQPPLPQTVAPVAPLAGDIVQGMSGERPKTTLELVRGGSKPTPYGPWQTTAFVQSVRFDNLNGTAHNVRGNLVGVDFGNTVSGTLTNFTTTGGNIYSFATQAMVPFAAPQVIGNTGASNTLGVTPTRLAGLSVSPDNTKIALAGFDSRKVMVFDYHAGNGLGAGATTVTGGRESTLTPLASGFTQGTTWLNNNTVLTMAIATNTTVDLIAINQSDMSETILLDDFAVPQTGTSKFTSLAYNPDISKYLFATYSGNDTTTGSNSHVYVFDPTNSYALVKDINLSAGTTTNPPPAGATQLVREIALHPDGRIFLSSFGIGPSAPTPGLGTTIFTISSSSNPAAIADLSATPYYASSSVQSFPSIDIGLLPGDFNHDGTVNGGDYVIWRKTNVGGAGGYSDWRASYGKSYANPAAGASLGVTTSVPEPASIVLLLVGLVGFGLRRRSA